MDSGPGPMGIRDNLLKRDYKDNPVIKLLDQREAADLYK